MWRQFQSRSATGCSVYGLLALSLLLSCLPASAHGQMQPSGRQPAVAAPSGSSDVQPTPQTETKLRTLIAEVLEPEVKMELTVHRSKLIRTKVPVTRFSITDPTTMDIVQFSPNEFELIGKKAGRTSFTLWFGENQALRYMVTVLPGSESEIAKIEYRKLQNKINEMFPNSMVQLIPIADKLIIRGQARDTAEAAQIMSVLTEGRGGASTGAGGVGTAHRGYSNGGNALGFGTAVNPVPGSNEIPAHSVVNLLTVPGEQQVMLRVRIAELSRTAARQMTSQLTVNNGNLNLTAGGNGLSAVFSSVLNSPEDIELAIKAVSSSGYAKILAEPNVVTLNGQPASFLAGGQFPVPTAVGIGGVSGINTQFQSYGTEVTFTPTIIDKDRIRLQVTPSFSQLDQSVSVEGIPGLKNRTVTTTVDLRVGQWLAIAGLLQDGQNGAKSRVPFIGDVPVVGSLFGQTEVQRNETELVILVSPELVHPMDAQETPLVLPGMEIGEPGDVAFFLSGAYVNKFDCPPQCAVQGAAPPAAAASPQQTMRDVTSRPDYQRSEKYYVYGSHGSSR
jgi:pilus assembly protein CpaC